MNKQEIEDWLVSHLADKLDLTEDEIDPDTPFEQFGIESVVAVDIATSLEELLGRELDPDILYHQPTIGRLAEHLALPVSQ